MKHLKDMSLDDLAQTQQIGTENEFLRRQTKAQIDTAKYMLWSVIAIAVTSGINALFAFLTWYASHSN